MSEVVIRAEGLSKRYFIGHQAEQEPYTALRDVISRSFKRLLRNSHNALRGQQIVGGDVMEEFWALRDLSFEIRQGEVVGIIGRNGAGKSTLLKILSRITEPTAGMVCMKGRVASLLEVGTGFHPELSGRENIFLNGALLGMSRREIKMKFDEIVSFAEVEKFLDTPVKRYSSGMYVRLAFSVAAHLDPEVLIVDEVLAVGDNEFQRKCLGKMDDVAKGGRTVLFVSHNMTTIERLCQRVLLLERGEVLLNAGVQEGIARYASSASRGRALDESEGRAGSGRARLLEAAVAPDIRVQGRFWLDLAYEAKVTLTALEVRVGIYASNGLNVCAFGTAISGFELRGVTRGTHRIRLAIPSLPLNVGQYSVNVSLSDSSGLNELIDVVEGAATFSVDGGDPYGTGKLPSAGAAVLPHRWERLPTHLDSAEPRP